MTDAQNQDHPEMVEVTMDAAIPQLDLFARNQPAIAEGPEDAWKVGRTLVDFGCAILGTRGQLRPDKRIRDAVLIALLRRALITTEAAFELLARGLLEPAVALGRTVLDIELSMKLVHNDATETMAKRLAAYHYYAHQRHGQDMLSNPETRLGPLMAGGRIPEIIAVAKGYARLLEGEAFDDVRDQVLASRYWHGHDNVEEAFKSIGRVDDYFVTYDAATWFVHDLNVDFDYNPSDDDAFHLKPLVERDPKVIQVFLANVLFRLLEIIRVYVDDRGMPVAEEFKEHSRIVLPDGSSETIDPLAAVTQLLLGKFAPNEGAT